MTPVPLRARIVDAVVWCAFWVAVGLWASCAHSRTPYTEEMSTGAFVPDWTGDQDMSVLRVVNPIGRQVRVTVGCVSDSGAVEKWDVDVAPQGSTTVLFQKLAKNWSVVNERAAWTRRDQTRLRVYQDSAGQDSRRLEDLRPDWMGGR